MDLGELFLFLGLCVPGILAAGVLYYLSSFKNSDWLRLIARAGLVSIAIAPSEDHGSLWPAIWGLISADHAGLESLLITWVVAMPLVYVINKPKIAKPQRLNDPRSFLGRVAVAQNGKVPSTRSHPPELSCKPSRRGIFQKNDSASFGLHNKLGRSTNPTVVVDP